MKIADIEDDPPATRSTKPGRKPPPAATKIVKTTEPNKEKRKRNDFHADYYLPQHPHAPPGKTWMTRKPEEFFEYLLSLKEHWTPESETENMSPVFRCYVYRKWPQIDNGLVGNRNSYIDRWHTWPFWDTGQGGDNGLEAVMIEDPKIGMLAKWGSGTYKISVNDLMANKPIAELTEWVIRPENINHFPPVLNYKTILMDVPENKNYITWRQQTGLPLPGEVTEENMANPVQDKMMEKIIDKALEDKPPQPQQAPSTAAGDAAAVASVQLMANVVDRLMSKPEPVQQQTGSEAITLAVTLIEKLQPKGSDAVMEMLREDRENTRRENLELRRQLMEVNKPKSLKEQLEELQALKDIMGLQGGGTRPVIRKEEPSFLDKHGTTILQLGTALIGAYMQAQKPQPQPQPQAQQQQPQPQPQAQPQQPEPQPQHQEEKGDPAAMMVKMVQQYLDTIAIPLFKHLSEGEGEDFADWLIGGYGEAAYKQAADLEFSLLLNAIATHPVIGKAMQDNNVPVERLATFIEHFKNPEKYWVMEEDEPVNKVIPISS